MHLIQQRRPAATGPELHRSIAAIHPGDWPVEQTFLLPGYLQALEETCAGQLSFHYALRRERGRAVAGAVFQVLDLDPGAGLPVLDGDFEGAALLAPGWRPLVRRFLGSLRLRLVICGNAFAAGPHGIWRAAALSDRDLADWLRDAARAVADRVAEPGLRVLGAFKDLDAVTAAALAAGHQALDGDPAMALALDPAWRSLDDYAAALRSRYRRELRRARDRGAGLVRRPLGGAAIRHHAAHIDALHQEVLAHARLVPVRQGAATFARLADTLGDRFSLIAYFAGERMVAFNTRFRCGADLDSHFFGMDYQVSEELALYRNLLYDDIGDAIGLGLRRVLFGRASQEIKSAIGATPLPLHSLIRHDSRLLTYVLAATARRLAPAEWTARRPFRR